MKKTPHRYIVFRRGVGVLAVSRMAAMFF